MLIDLSLISKTNYSFRSNLNSIMNKRQTLTAARHFPKGLVRAVCENSNCNLLLSCFCKVI